MRLLTADSGFLVGGLESPKRVRSAEPLARLPRAATLPDNSDLVTVMGAYCEARSVGSDGGSAWTWYMLAKFLPLRGSETSVCGEFVVDSPDTV